MADVQKNRTEPSTRWEILQALGDVLEDYQIASYMATPDGRPSKNELEDAALVRLGRAQMEDEHEERMFLVAQAQVFATLAASRGDSDHR